MAMVLVDIRHKEDRLKKLLCFTFSKMIQAIASEITNAIGTTANANQAVFFSALKNTGSVSTFGSFLIRHIAD